MTYVKPVVGMVCFGEVNTPYERLEIKHREAVQQLAELEQSVLKAAGNADAQNFLDFARMPLEGEHARIRNPAVQVAEGALRDVRAHGARNQRRQPRAHHAPAQPEDSHAVADEVDDVHDEG